MKKLFQLAKCFSIEYCSKCRFLCSFRRNSEIFSNFSIPNFSKLKWLKDAGQRQAPCRLFTFAFAPLIHCPFDSLPL
jgi:hypothetical protein